MKKAVILHGTDSSPDDHWLPWMRTQLELAGYEVFCPDLPGKHTPNRMVYERFLRDSGWDFADNILIGHSSGSTTILNLLSADWFPRVKAAVLVGAFLNEKLTKSKEWYEAGQFDELFPESFDAQLIKSKAGKFCFIHGSDDENCDIDDARKLCDELGGTFVEVENGQHLGSSSGVKELPQAMGFLGEVL